VAAALIVPAAAIPVAVAAALALALRHGRVLLAAACVGLAVGVDWIVAASQAHHHFPAEFGWPSHFETAGRVAWLAVAVLAADAVVEVARGRRLGFRRTAAGSRVASVMALMRPGRGRHVRRS
jgi:hypothetical protein